jgi:excisionase family DNA binding protein
MGTLESLLTTEDVAKILRVDVVTVRRLVSRGELATYRIGAEYRFTVVDLQDYLKRRYVPVGVQLQPTEKVDQLLGPYWLLREILAPLGKAPLGKSRSGSKPAMGERFTETATHALALAQAAAERQRCGHIHTSHLLLGLAEEAGGMASRALGELGITAERIKSVLADHPKLTGPTRKTGDGLGLDPDVKRTLEATVAQARKLSHGHVGTEHLLLGLLENPNGKAAGVMKALQVTPDALRSKLRELMKQTGS